MPCHIISQKYALAAAALLMPETAICLFVVNSAKKDTPTTTLSNAAIAEMQHVK